MHFLSIMYDFKATFIRLIINKHHSKKAFFKKTDLIYMQWFAKNGGLYPALYGGGVQTGKSTVAKPLWGHYEAMAH